MTAIAAALAALLISLVLPRADRRRVKTGLTLLAVVSDVIVAAAPNLAVLLAARLLLGVALGGLWAMATSMAAHLVPAHHLGRALTVINSGVAVATVAAVPLGAWLGDVWGWRGVFLLGAGAAVLALIAQAVTLPSVTPTGASGLRALGAVLRSGVVLAGLSAILLIFGGHFSGFTYIRPAAESLSGIDAGGFALLLLVFGAAHFAGTAVAGPLADRSPRTGMFLFPAVLTVRCGMTFTPRAAWAGTPAPVRTAVAEALGTTIAGHTDLHGGMSPGPAAALRLTDGRQVFVKAVSAEVRAHNHAMIRQESAILDALPPTVPAPERLATVACGPWIALVTTWAAGTTAGPWTDASIAAVARACRTASGHRAPGVLPPVPERLSDFDGWSRVVEAGPADDWEAAYAEPAAGVTAGWQRWTAGDALVHRDVRRDNTAVDAGSAVLLDWAYAAAGAPWIDVAQLAADVVATGHAGGPEVATDRAHRLVRTLPPEASRFVVGLAGMWRIRAATIPDTVLPDIAVWRRARSAALRPLVTRLLTG